MHQPRPTVDDASRIPLVAMVVAVFATLALTGSPAVRAQGEEVPFITTPDHVTRAMLDLAAVRAGDRLVDLGSGDGRIVIEAARRGAQGLGVEIVPELVARSRENAKRAGVAARTDFREQDLFQTSLAGATVVTMYLLPELNLKLRPRLLALPPGTRIVSHDWAMGDWTSDRSLTLDVPDKAIGRQKSSTLHLWVVPAAVQGRWCAGAVRLDIDQRFQRYTAVLTAAPGRGADASSPSSTASAPSPEPAPAPAPLLVQDGSIDPADGLTLRPGDGALAGLASMTLRLEGDVLRVLESSVLADRAPPPGTRLQRSAIGTCPG